LACGYVHLSMAERVVIESQLRLGYRPATIAFGLCRPPSTVLREMRRNGWRLVGKRGFRLLAGGYRAVSADRRARQLVRKPRRLRKLVIGTELWERVTGMLRRRLSPPQIARTLRRMPDPVRLSAETIYTTLYAMPRGALRRELLNCMRRHHQDRRQQRRGSGARKPPIPDMILIDQRPEEINRRLVPGHWEGDMIIGKANRSQVGVLVERRTLFLALVRLESPRAEPAGKAFSSILNRFSSQMRRSLTYDQGSEMRHHQRLTEDTGVEVFFAHPRSPWERGIAENTNGLLRQYLPKAQDLSGFTQDQLDDIAWSMNVRPRKTLDWKAPAELFLPVGDFDFVKYWSSIIDPVALGS